MSLGQYKLNSDGSWAGVQHKGIVRKVSENPSDYAILDAEAAGLLGLPDEEVKGLMLVLQCTSEAQNLVHPKSYTEF